MPETMIVPGRRRSNGERVTKAAFDAIRRADRARDRNDWGDAMAGYRTAIGLAPGLSHLWMQLGNCAGEAQRWDDALAAYHQAQVLDPTGIEPRLFAARIHHRLGAFAAAAKSYASVLAIEPRHPEAADRVEEERLRRRRQPVFELVAAGNRHPVLPAGMSIAEMQQRLDRHHFHHGIDFGDGLVSKAQAGVTVVAQTAEALYGALDLTGRSLLDVGAWTGAYSFEAKIRGADRVLATDHHVWNHPVFRGREAFNLALGLTGLDLDVRDIDVDRIEPDSVGRFDIVLFAGVFYHLIDPVAITKRISACADHLLIVETHLDELDNPHPAMRFYPGRTLNDDGSNWWGPNPHCMFEILTELNFHDIWYCDAPMMGGRGIFHAFRGPDSRRLFSWKATAPWQSLSDGEVRRRLFAPRHPDDAISPA